MRLAFWVTALAVLSLAHAKNSTANSKPKRQLDSIRTPTNLQYSLVLPHSRVTHYRSLTSERRISHAAPRAGKLPPYAVQMEPVVQYSQKDPLYDPSLNNLDDTIVNKNEIYAQSKISNVQDQHPEGTYGPPYGTLPTAPLYSHEPHSHSHQHQQYYDVPEPIIEIIIKESNETLPAPAPPVVPKKKKEPVHVFYVKYSKDPHHKDKVVYEKPIPAITPPTNDEDDHHSEYVTVTPEPLYIPQETTTLRAIIKPESQLYHSDSTVKITFGNEGHHHSDRREGHLQSEDHEETAPSPAIAHPLQPPSHPHIERSASVKPQQHEPQQRPLAIHPTPQTYNRPITQHAQNRVQFQPTFFNEQQLPRQSPSISPFRTQQQNSRQNPFGPTPNFGSNFPGQFSGAGPTVPGPLGPVFPSNIPRPSNGPAFHSRPSNPPPFGSRINFNGPPRPNFNSGPQRPPFHQSQSFFDEPKYLQENYHTITTEQVDPSKDQLLPNKLQQNFNVRPNPSPSPGHFQENQNRPQLIPFNQQLPQQRPSQPFIDNHKPSFPVSPSRPPFFNLKPSPPQIENSHNFHQHLPQPQQQPFSFHQGVQPSGRPLATQQNIHNHNSILPSPSPSPDTQNQFLPQPSSPTIFNFHPQPSPTPVHQHFDRPQYSQQHGPSERPFTDHQNNFKDVSNIQHQQNVGQFVPNGGELIASLPKYEQHITVNGPTAQPDYSGLSQPSQPTPTASEPVKHYHQQQQQPQQEQHQQHHQHHHHQQQNQYQQQQSLYDPEQEQVRLQLAQNVQKQQEEIQRLQAQIYLTQQQNQHHEQQNKQYEQQQQQQQNYQQARNNYRQQVQATSAKSQVEKSGPPFSYVSSTPSPQYYQSTSRTVEIKPTTQKYVSSTINSISSASAAKKEEKKRPTVELPDEVPDDLRQQLLSSGILDNADISILDYDKVGETPLESLPPDQLANFFSAGGGQQIAASEPRPIVVAPNGDSIQSRMGIEDDDEEDQDIAASENLATYVDPPSANQAVEMKVVHFDPKTAEGQNIANEYVKEDATQVEPVTLNDKKYNRYLPLKVSGNQFPLPDILKGRKVTSVVVLAPVETELINGDHNRAERAATGNLKGIKFVAGDSLQDLLRRPTKDNFQKWLDIEKKIATDLQSVVLLVTGNDDPSAEREIYMYDVTSGNANKLSGDLSNAFVEAAENNSLSRDYENLAIEGDGTPEQFNREPENDKEAEASENVPLFVDISGLSLDRDETNQVSISTGYSKTKQGRSVKRH